MDKPKTGMKRRLDLWSAPAGPAAQRRTSVGEVLPVEVRLPMPGPCVVLAAAGPAAESPARAFSDSLVAALTRAGAGPAGVFDLEGSEKRSAVVAGLEQRWPDQGWVLVRGLDLLAVRRVAWSIVWHEGVIPGERHPLLRALESNLDLELWGPESTALVDGLAKAWASAIQSTGR